jgi:hypothetical protein
LDCNKNYDRGACTWDWKGGGKWLEPRTNWEKGIVSYIKLGLYYNLTVGQVIDKYGQPEKVRILSGGIPEHWYWIVDFYYPDEGLLFISYTQEFSTVLTRQTEVGGIYYYAPTTLRDWIKLLEGETSSLDRMQPWKGFGDLSKLYPGDVPGY